MARDRPIVITILAILALIGAAQALISNASNAAFASGMDRRNCTSGPLTSGQPWAGEYSS